MGRAGLVMGIVAGIAFLVITIIIAFLVISEVTTVQEEIEGSPITTAVYDETGSVNASSYTLLTAGFTGFTNPVVTSAVNTTDGVEIVLANLTTTDAGVITNSTTATNGFDFVTFNYTYDSKVATIAGEQMNTNFTSGINNISNKLPTILLIAAVVLILGVLALLWEQFKRMNVGGGEASGSL